MNNRFSCALNGVTLESIDPAIRVTDLTELPPRRKVVTASTARHGLHLLRRVRESLTVRVSFMIQDCDPVQRRTVLSRVHAWADPGGLLTTSDRPGQQLSVICDTLPTHSALCWTDEMQVEFTAYSVPFWELTEETEIMTTGSSLMILGGNADECPVSVEVTNTGSAALTTLTLGCGGTHMTFDEIQVSAGGVFTLAVADGLLTADASGVSVLMLRTDDSSDLLLADGGAETEVSVSGDQPVSARFHGRGRLL